MKWLKRKMVVCDKKSLIPMRWVDMITERYSVTAHYDACYMGKKGMQYSIYICGHGTHKTNDFDELVNIIMPALEALVSSVSELKDFNK